MKAADNPWWRVVTCAGLLACIPAGAVAQPGIDRPIVEYGDGDAADPAARLSPGEADEPGLEGLDMPAAGEEAAGQGSWRYVLHDVQAGPLSTARLQELVSRGVLDGRVRVWRRGMEQWRFLWEVPELAHLVRVVVVQGGKLRETCSMARLHSLLVQGRVRPTDLARVHGFSGLQPVACLPWIQKEDGGWSCRVAGRHLDATTVAARPAQPATVGPANMLTIEPLGFISAGWIFEGLGLTYTRFIAQRFSVGLSLFIRLPVVEDAVGVFGGLEITGWPLLRDSMGLFLGIHMQGGSLFSEVAVSQNSFGPDPETVTGPGGVAIFGMSGLRFFFARHLTLGVGAGPGVWYDLTGFDRDNRYGIKLRVLLDVGARF